MGRNIMGCNKEQCQKAIEEYVARSSTERAQISKRVMQVLQSKKDGEA